MVRFLLRSRGLNDWTMSSDGPGVVSDDDGSRSSKTSAVAAALDAFRWPFWEARHSCGMGPLTHVEAIRKGSFFVAMLGDGHCGW